ncbi:hypothetical protein [Streptomyces sp. H39-C1]|uniref:hypothetical protein n=1 Tax=Streptomyces sp. H39-C1 TaxID=3004355 RepID=UPI0022AF5D22|nr:hypothetical protein [Streptomyces sp. H39-C1]MCZ4103211.1 hypothetical protein [Streptomyces sp. H39-C1]
MSFSRTTLASLPALPVGAAAVFEHSAVYALAALALWSVLANLPALIDVAARWGADQPRRERERIGNQALRQIGQTDPERVVALLAGLPPLANAFGHEPSAAEGPAPPESVAPPGDAPAGGTAASG